MPVGNTRGIVLRTDSHFVCARRSLIVELDGAQHANRTFGDDERTRYLRERGYRVLRFWNNDVLGNRAGVLLRIVEALEDADAWK